MNIETWIKIWRGGFLVALLGVSQFIVLCICSMFIYPGGSLVDPATIGYSLSGNYLSDLGRGVSLSNSKNAFGAFLFNSSITVLGISMLPFFLFMPTQAEDRVLPLSIAALIGVISCFSLIAIGQCPVDLFPSMHMVGLFAWLVTMFFASGLHALALLSSKDNPTMLALLSVAVCMFTVSYMYHGMDTAAAVWFAREEIPLQAVLLQKLVVIAGLIWFFAFSAQMLLRTDFSSYRERDVSGDTDDYLEQISDNPRR